LFQHATVLIAAQDAALVDSLQFALELEGFTVRVLRDLAEALDGGHAQPQHCLVIDQELLLGVAGIDGQSALRRSGMPVVLLAGHRTDDLLKRAAAAGVTAVVEKPLLGAALLEEIRKVFDAAGPPPD
jgi:DNA-binding NtrC family response regulator